MRKKHITQMDILYLSVSLFVLVIFWVASDLYHTWVTTTISEDLQIQITPIAPKFDTATIEALKQREKIDPLFEITAIPEASESAEEETLDDEEAPPVEDVDVVDVSEEVEVVPDEEEVILEEENL